MEDHKLVRALRALNTLLVTGDPRTAPIAQRASPVFAADRILALLAENERLRKAVYVAEVYIEDTIEVCDDPDFWADSLMPAYQAVKEDAEQARADIDRVLAPSQQPPEHRGEGGG